jgi:hypothetical protein
VSIGVNPINSGVKITPPPTPPRTATIPITIQIARTIKKKATGPMPRGRLLSLVALADSVVPSAANTPVVLNMSSNPTKDMPKVITNKVLNLHTVFASLSKILIVSPPILTTL